MFRFSDLTGRLHADTPMDPAGFSFAAAFQGIADFGVARSHDEEGHFIRLPNGGELVGQEGETQLTVNGVLFCSATYRRCCLYSDADFARFTVQQEPVAA